jgi:uncharacterized delta-60 repeat protein
MSQRSIHFTILVLLLAVFPTTRIFAQAGVLDPTFPVLVNLTVNVAEVLPSGKVFIGGDFSSCNLTPVQRMAGLHPNGSNDFSFATFATQGGADGPVRSSAIQPDGKILVGGLFNNVNGLPRKNIARIDSTGAVDPLFVVGTGANNEVTHISTNGSRIVLSGFFNTYNGLPAPGIVVLHMDGSVDTTFVLPSSWVNISATAVLPNNQVYLAGNFTTYLGTPINRAVRLNPNGTIDTTFNTGAGLNALVHTLAIQPDGKVIVAGAFQVAQGVSRNRIARFNANGSLDTTFNPGTGASGGVRALALEPGGKIFIGGDFVTYNGVTVNRIARLHPGGSLDTSYLSMSGTNGTVSSLRVQADGKLLVAGGFSQIQGVSQGRIARLTTDLCIGDTIPPVPLIPFLTPVTGICEVTITTAPTATDLCAGLITATTNDPLYYNTQGNWQVQWVFDDGNGNFAYQVQQVYVTGVNTMIAVDTMTPGSSYQLRAIHAGAGVTYQWIDCSNGSAPLTGDTLQQFVPQASGSYAVIVFEDGCADTSVCIPVTISTIGLQKVTGDRWFQVYPNPTSGWLTISLLQAGSDGSLVVTDVHGRTLMREHLTNERQILLDVRHLPDGLYLVVIQQGGTVDFFRWIKHSRE